MEYGDPTKAEVTWNGSKSYRFAGNSQLIFKEGKTKVLTDSELIKRCQNTAGFAVRVLATHDKPKVRKTVKAKPKKADKAEAESKPKKSTKASKKKTTKKKSSYYSD